MSDVVELGGFEIGLLVEFVAVLELHRGVGVEASSEIMNNFLQLGGAISLLYHKYPWQFLLELSVDLFMGSRFFLYKDIDTLRPPTFGI